MRPADGLAFGAVAILVALAGLMAAAEVATTRTTRVRAQHLRDEGARGAGSLLHVAENPAPHLNVILLLTLLFHLGGTTIATAAAVQRLGGLGEVVATVAMTLILFVLAEVTPKTFTVLHTDRVALRLAPLIVALARAFGPVARGLIAFANWVLPGKGLREGPFVTEAEILAMTDAASDEQAIEEGEKELIHSIFEFGDTVVREVMVPRPDMVTMDAQTVLKDALGDIIRQGFSRVPVRDRDRDDIVGVVHAKDVLRHVHAGEVTTTLAEIARPASFVPDSKKVSALLRDMQREKFHMALVVDEFGSVVGLVTLEDLLEELVGEIADEYDLDEPDVEPLGTERFRVNARMSVQELNELLGVALPSGEWDTVGGLMMGVLGRVPEEGEQVTVGDLRFVAEQVLGRRVSKLLVERVGPTGDEESLQKPAA